MSAVPTTLASALDAVIAKVAENQPLVPGDCEKIAETIAILNTWYSRYCPGV